MSFLQRMLGRAPHPAPGAQALRDGILEFTQNEAQRQYALTHIGRLVRTLQLTPPGSAGDRVLEMGAYMQITPALKTHLGYRDVRGCYLGPLGKTDDKRVTSQAGQEFQCFIDLFNAERDRYPYEDGAFATVICAELLEHLSEDPMHLMSEVNRILRPGGHFILSTPNIASFRSVSAALRGEHPGLYQQYIRAAIGAGANAEPRHAREYAPAEIPRLFAAAGLEVEALETGAYGEENPPETWVVDLLKRGNLSLELRGDTIHAVGRKAGPVVDRYPAWLYD